YVEMAPNGEGGVAMVWASPQGSFFASGSLDQLRRGTLTPRRVDGLFALLSQRSSGAFEYRMHMQPLDHAGVEVAVVPELNRDRFAVEIATTSDGGAVIGWKQNIHRSGGEVRVVRITPDGALLRLPIQPVNRGFVEYDAPAVRRCDDTFVTAWVERSDRERVRFRRVSVTGDVLDPPSRRVTALSDDDQESPRLACTGNSILITWIETPPLNATGVAARGRGLLIVGRTEQFLDFGAADDVYAAAIGDEYAVFRTVRNDMHEGSRWSATGEQRTAWRELFSQPTCGNPPRASIESSGEQLLIAHVNGCSTQGSAFVIARELTRDFEQIGRPVVFQADSYAADDADIAASP